MNREVSTRPETVGPEQWVETYGDYLFRFALSRLQGRELAEEVVQETFLSALKNVDQYTGRGSERSWLAAILKNKIMDHYRRRQRDPRNLNDRSEDIAEMLFDSKGSWRRELRYAIRSSLDTLDRKEFWRIFRGCLGSLPGRQADVFAMRVMDDLESERICKEMEISSTNYWVMLHRARLALSSCMKQRWYQES